jgi:signal transduction histidine kinase
MRPAVRAWLVDIAVTVAVAAVIQVAISVATEPGSRPAGPVGHLLGLLMALPLLAHRRVPVAAMYVTAILLTVYYASNFPGFAPTPVLLVPLYFATEAGRVWWVAPAAALFLVVGVVVGFGHHTPPLDILNNFLPHFALVTIAVLLALLVRGRRALAVETRERLRLAAEERDREAARRVVLERLRIARDLHDTVAHAFATIAVQSGTALHVLDDRPDQVRQALRAIRSTGREALSEMRATLGVLREGDEGADVADHAAGLDRLPALLTAVRAAGLTVTVDTDGVPASLPSTVDHAAYRILQESLTNVLRHAGPEASATVRLEYRPDVLCLVVLDDGTGGADSLPGAGSGHGVAGMRERAAALGGTVTAGPSAEGGFAVQASLPVAAP